jgi:hypothetical protein
VQRPTKFEHFRWIGDRRNQTAYDVDNLQDESIITELLKGERVEGLNGVPYTCFSPDTLAEARNRGYRPYRGNGSGAPDSDD